MPVMNGLEEARALRKLMPTVPVIVFTAFVSSALEKKADASGASAIISKSEPIRQKSVDQEVECSTKVPGGDSPYG